MLTWLKRFYKAFLCDHTWDTRMWSGGKPAGWLCTNCNLITYRRPGKFTNDPGPNSWKIDPCPKCGADVVSGDGWSGVKCSRCNWWDCI